MSWLSSFLHPERGYEEAQKQLEKYYQQSQNLSNQGIGALQPYNQNGQNAYSGLNTAMQNLMNPAQLENQWSQGYKESDLARQNEAGANQRGLEAASSMGLMGSSPAIQAIQSGTSGIVAQDRQKYMDDLMQKYLSGIGLGQNIYGQGLNAAGNINQNFMNQGQNANQMGQNTAQAKFGEQNAPGNMFSKLLEGLVSFGTPIAQNWGMSQLGLNPTQGWSPKGTYNGQSTAAGGY